MKLGSRVLVVISIVFSALTILPQGQAASVKLGAACPKVGASFTVTGKVLVCSKSGTKLIWKQSVAKVGAQCGPVKAIVFVKSDAFVCTSAGVKLIWKLKTFSHVSIAFFGASAANAFTQGMFRGIQSYAQAHNADVTFFDGKFDGPTQVSQIQDATTSGKYKLFIVYPNDGGILLPAVKDAVAQGIKVVSSYTPVGTLYDSRDPQVAGTYFVGDLIRDNGKILGQMGLQACKLVTGVCHVAYLRGSTAPYDNARTDAVVGTLQNAGVDVVSNYIGGYTPDLGRTVGQDLFQAHPEVNVVIGSGAAIQGVEGVIPANLKGKIQLVGNSGSTYAVQAVQEGRWFACYYIPVGTVGSKAAEVGLGAVRGIPEPKSVLLTQLGNVIGTAANLKGVAAQYTN